MCVKNNDCTHEKAVHFATMISSAKFRESKMIAAQFTTFSRPIAFNDQKPFIEKNYNGNYDF